MVLIFEVSFASVAIILCVVSLRTLRAIKHLSVGKSFWLPILFSGIAFFIESVITVLSELGFSFSSYTLEIISLSQLVALCFLVSGIYSYSRKITKNLVEKFPLPERTHELVVEANSEPKSPESVIEQLDENQVKNEADCKHQFGYLQTLQRRAHIPEECLDCHRIIECKYSIVKKPENASKLLDTPKTIRSITVSDNDNLEKEKAESSG
jgi:hypothetical protein